MRRTDNADFDSARLLGRLDDIIGWRRLPNGQPLAPAFAVAFAEDMRAAGRTAADALALPDHVLIDAGLDLCGVIAYGGIGVMPFGTAIQGSESGCVTIGGCDLVMDAGRAGLHPLETARRDAHGPNLDLLLTLIARQTRNLACRRIGLPQPHFAADRDAWNLLLFPPLAEAGGVMLQRPAAGTGAARFSAATPEAIGRFATSIVADMRMLWKRRREIAAAVVELRGMAQAGIDGSEGAGRDIRLAKITTDLEGGRLDDPLSFYLEYDGLDEALRPGAMLTYKDWVFHWDRAPLDHVPRIAASRAIDLETLRSVGADGRIDDIAFAVSRAAPEGAAAILEHLSREMETQVVIPGREAPLYATLFWSDGIIRAEVAMADIVNVDRDRVELHGVDLPATITAALVGRPLSDLIELPFACDCVVDEVRRLGSDGIRVRLRVGTSLVNTRTGAIWPEADSPG